MSEAVPVQEFSSWDGTPFFEGYPEQGRRVYLDRQEDGFMAYGVIEPKPQCVFQVHGSNEEELKRFLAEVKAEHAHVTRGLPPFEVKTGGDKPPDTDLTPPGYKGGKPLKPK